MATRSEFSTPDFILTLFAVRLAAIVVSLIAFTAFERPHSDGVACGLVESKPMQARESRDPIEDAIQDMLHHD